MYNSKVVKEAIEILKHRRTSAKNENNRHFEEVSSAVPEVAKIIKELSATSHNLVRVLNNYTGAERDRQFEMLKIMNLDYQSRLEKVLTSAGYSADYLEVHYFCGKCKDTGYTDGYRCECLGKLLIEIAERELSKISQSGNCSFENFNVEYYKNTKCQNDSERNPTGVNVYDKMLENSRFAKNYAENFSEKSESIFMIGLTGLGKTHLSLAIANVVIKKGYNVICGVIGDVMRKLEEQQFGRVEYDASIMQDILEADLLLLDDLGSEFKNSFSESKLYDIINIRINNTRPTIINTNLTVEEMEERYNTRITSRLFFNFKRISFVGDDIRRKKKGAIKWI